MLNKVADIPELAHLFTTFFAFVKKYHIHSFIDHMSNYQQLERIILDSTLFLVQYNVRMDSYSIRMENPSNNLVDLVFLFPFGKQCNENQVMVTLNNKKIYAEIIIASQSRLSFINLIPPPKRSWRQWFQREKGDAVTVMTLAEWESFLEENSVQRPRKFKG